jgi:putative Ca2+/H+ antiporter (TMEM165/GDT1 family)
VFSRVTIGFGLAVIAVSVLAVAIGATPGDTATIPEIVGVLLVVFGWLGRRLSPQQSPRQRSPSLIAIMLAGALIFSSTHGIELVFDAVRTGTPLTSTGVYRFAMVLAGVAYIVFSGWSDVVEAQRIRRERAAAAVAPAPPRRRSGRSGRSGRARR